MPFNQYGSLAVLNKSGTFNYIILTFFGVERRQKVSTKGMVFYFVKEMLSYGIHKLLGHRYLSLHDTAISISQLVMQFPILLHLNALLKMS